MTDLDFLIDDLAADAAPVQRQRSGLAHMVLAALAALSVAVLGVVYGLRADVATLSAPTPTLMAIGLLAILAAAAGGQAIRMARPQVGAPSSGVSWMTGAVGLLPLIALATVATQPGAVAGLDAEIGSHCLGVGIASGVASLAFLGFWLRRGAPVAPERAAWLAGLAAGAVGAAAVTIECEFDNVVHLGLWHVAVVAALAVAGRAILPRFIRW